jgi:hypothetical protein
MAIDFLQSFCLRLLFHLRVAFEDLGVGLAEQLRQPLAGYVTCTEASGMRGSQIKGPEYPKIRRFPRSLRASEAL